MGFVYLLNFLIGKETQFCNKVFSRGGYLKGENCLVVCKNFPVCDFKIKELERALKVTWSTFSSFYSDNKYLLGPFCLWKELTKSLQHHHHHSLGTPLCACAPTLPPDWPTTLPENKINFSQAHFKNLPLNPTP